MTTSKYNMYCRINTITIIGIIMTSVLASAQQTDERIVSNRNWIENIKYNWYALSNASYKAIVENTIFYQDISESTNLIINRMYKYNYEVLGINTNRNNAEVADIHVASRCNAKMTYGEITNVIPQTTGEIVITAGDDGHLYSAAITNLGCGVVTNDIIKSVFKDSVALFLKFAIVPLPGHESGTVWYQEYTRELRNKYLDQITPSVRWSIDALDNENNIVFKGTIQKSQNTPLSDNANNGKVNQLNSENMKYTIKARFDLLSRYIDYGYVKGENSAGGKMFRFKGYFQKE